jgi:hypothetical protein
MKNSKTGQVLTVVEHLITRNFWEYYITNEGYDGQIKTALVMGYETELGDVDLGELANYTLSRTSRLKEVAPAVGWEWVN